VLPQILEVNKEGCQYTLKPISVNHLQKTLEERLALQLDLFTEAVMRYKLDVLQTILSGDGYISTVRNEIEGLCDSEFCECNGSVAVDKREDAPSTATVKLRDRSSGLPV